MECVMSACARRRDGRVSSDARMTTKDDKRKKKNAGLVRRDGLGLSTFNDACSGSARDGRGCASNGVERRVIARHAGGAHPDALVSYLSVVRGRSQELSAHPVDLPVVLGDAHFADGPILHPRSAGRGVGGERRARGGRAGGAPAHTRERASRLPKHSGSLACARACAEGAQMSPNRRDILTHHKDGSGSRFRVSLAEKHDCPL